MVPTLFTAGEFDEVTADTMKFYQELISGSELAVVPGSGHLTTIDQPVLYAQAVRDFLNRADRH